MDADQDLTVLLEKLDLLVDFLDEFQSLTNCHLVNFITKNLFDQLVPDNLRDELLNLTVEDLCRLPSCQLEPNLHNENLIRFMTNVHELALPNVLKNTRFVTEADTLSKRNKFKFDQYMGPKKSHEVEEMACTVAACAADRNIDCVSFFTCFRKSYDRFCTSGCRYRERKRLFEFFVVHVFWNESLRFRRFRWEHPKVVNFLHCLTYFPRWFDLISDVFLSAHKRQKNVRKHWIGIVKKVSGMEKVDRLTDDRLYTPVTCCIDHTTDLSEILKSNDASDDLVVCGLHTCGELASHSMNMFLRCNQAKFLCLVGCCYHLLDEKFAANHYKKKGLEIFQRC